MIHSLNSCEEDDLSLIGLVVWDCLRVDVNAVLPYRLLWLKFK